LESCDVNAHENYPTEFHRGFSDATEKEIKLSRIGHWCLRNGSAISKPFRMASTVVVPTVTTMYLLDHYQKQDGFSLSKDELLE
jgi:hypothetical protein